MTVAELKTVVNEHFKINQLLVKPRYKHLRRSQLQEFIDFQYILLDQYIYMFFKELKLKLTLKIIFSNYIYMTWKKIWSEFHIRKQTQLFNYLVKTYKNLNVDTFIDV